MRAAIVLWSAVSGLVLGLFAGLLLLGALTIAAQLLPARVDWLIERLRAPVLLACLVLLPAAGAVLGLLEGRLKLR